MDNMMSGIGWTHGVGVAMGILLLIVLGLGIAALIKYLRQP